MRRSQAGRKKVSQFGQYHGYSEAIYDGYQRSSQHLALEDGTRTGASFGRMDPSFEVGARTNGWYDLFTTDMFLWYANLTVPRRLVVRPLDHSQSVHARRARERSLADGCN